MLDLSKGIGIGSNGGGGRKKTNLLANLFLVAESIINPNT